MAVRHRQIAAAQSHVACALSGARFRALRLRDILYLALSQIRTSNAKAAPVRWVLGLDKNDMQITRAMGTELDCLLDVGGA